MNKEFISARLQFTAIDPVTEAKSSLSLNDLREEAEATEVNAFKAAIQAVLEDPIESTTAILTYQFA